MKENLTIKSNKKNATPVMKQFWEAKESYPDSIMLFRMGDFYETFDEDAKIASNILGIALTKRANGAASSVPLAGFPFHSLDQYLHKLLSAGYRVAICEQVEDPKLAKGIVKREVVELLSPGTAIADKYLNYDENNYLCSIYIKRNNFGYAILDYSTGEFSSGKNNIKELYNTLNQYKISEVILCKKQTQYLDQSLIKNILITSYHDWIATQDNCYEKLLDHFGTNSLKGFGLDKDDLEVIASGTALSYVENNFFGKVKHITSLSKIRRNNVMRIDPSTLKNLELFQSLSSDGDHGTLISTIDHTKTPMGARLLKKHIRAPLLSKNKINNRLKLVEEFINKYVDNKIISDELKEVSDIPRILAKIATNKCNPRDLINLSNSLLVLPKIKKLVSKSKPILKVISKSTNTRKVCKEINRIIIDDPPLKLHKGGFIKQGVSKKLDKLRSISDNANKWLVDFQENQKIKTGINSLKISYNKVFGYYIDVTKTHLDKVPSTYIRKQTLTNSERYFTEELKEYEEKILSSSEKTILLENSIFEKLVETILNNVKTIQNNSNIIAQLDIISSHAVTARTNNYIKPKIIDKSTKFVVKKSKHPVIENLLPPGEKFISNDIDLDNNKKQIAIITGPNMAGKSTFLRQVGLIAILGQIGSYVPAKSAEISIIDQLFTRVGASDNLAGGESTFLVEMNEAANILNNATPNSLIILDEIGRGTSTFDGLSLAWSITEYLHNNIQIKAKTLFATHYHELIELAELLPDAFNLNSVVDEHDGEIIFLRKIKKGGANKSYGINVAKMAGMPSYVINRANELLLEFLNDKDKTNPKLTNSIKQINIFNNNDILLEELKNIDLENITPIEAINKLNSIKNKIS